MKKYSRQRESILSLLKSVSCHPTASWIYDHVREDIPNISLGTVYRNLSELKKAGDIISFTPADGVERFDGDIRPHFHLVCSSCHEVADIPNVDMDNVVAEAENVSGCNISGFEVLFDGICKDCLSKTN